MKKSYIALISALAVISAVSITLCAILFFEKKQAQDALKPSDKSVLPDYTIIYREEYAASAAQLLADELTSLTGTTLSIYGNEKEHSGKSIHIAAPLTDSTYLDFEKELGRNGYRISFDENGNINLFAYTEEAASKAVLCLIEKYLVKRSDGQFIFNTDLGYSQSEKYGTEHGPSLVEAKKELRFTEGENFKILIISDVHVGTDANSTTLDAIEAMVDAESPDLVLLAGNIQSKITDKATLKDLLTKVCAPMEKRSIPWAHVFGPDDSASGMSLDLQMEVYGEFEYCLSKKGELSLNGVSNYFLPILSSSSDEIKFGVWGFDSSLPAPDKTYGYIAPGQVSWFLSAYSSITKQAATPIPSIIFMCTPLSEFAALAESGKISGNIGETVSLPSLNSGLFSAALSTKNVLGIYCGYDHLNDFSGKYQGIELAYLSSIGYDGYGLGGTFETNNSLRGARLLEINENDIKNYTSKMIYAADYGISREAK